MFTVQKVIEKKSQQVGAYYILVISTPGHNPHPPPAPKIQISNLQRLVKCLTIIMRKPKLTTEQYLVTTIESLKLLLALIG